MFRVHAVPFNIHILLESFYIYLNCNQKTQQSQYKHLFLCQGLSGHINVHQTGQGESCGEV